MVAVGIPTCERPYTLSCCLASLFAQKDRPSHLFIVDQSRASIPVPPELALMLRAWSFTETRISYMPDTNRPYTWAARKRIVEAAVSTGTKTLVFVDDDMVLCAGALVALQEALIGDRAFAMGTYVSADLRQGWAEGSELKRGVPGPEYHWYDIDTFGVGADAFATTFVAMPVPILADVMVALEEVPMVHAISGDPAFLGSDDRVMAAYLEAKGYGGVIVPKARAAHVAPDAGGAGTKEHRRAWLDERLREEVLREHS